MTLTLTIRNVGDLENGAPTEFVLHRRGATIGRAATCDWSLPDPHRYISSRHCEIVFADGSYVVNDISTNGTFLNGAVERMSQQHVITAGDLLQIGHYEIMAELSGSAMVALAANVETPPTEPGWSGWDSHMPPPAAAQVPEDFATGGWSDPDPYVPAASPAASAAPSPEWEPALSRAVPGAASNWGVPPPPPPPPAAAGWSPSHRAQIPVASPWEQASPVPEQASGWSSAAPDRPPAPSPDDVWGRIAEGNVVDWARGGFGRPAAMPGDPLGLASEDGAAQRLQAPPLRREARSIEPVGPAAPSPALAPSEAKAAPDPAPSQSPAPGAGDDVNAVLREFLGAAGLTPEDVRSAGPGTLIKAGTLLRRLVAGLVVLVEARARAKSQMGAESTRLELDGNNPIKFARAPEQALAQLLGPRERGFMEAERAIGDAFFDLQSHQMATLKAMQGALKATLERFSPDAIRRRTEHRGLLSKLLPGARDAALWQGYEREFGGVARGSDEAFMDVFAKEFRKAYEEQSRQRR